MHHGSSTEGFEEIFREQDEIKGGTHDLFMGDRKGGKRKQQQIEKLDLARDFMQSANSGLHKR